MRELERLRQENARLSRLLEVRGDTPPADEQPAIPVHRPGPVTHESPIADKLALYAELFRARRDVYALRWENHRTGRSGWSPAVAGGWGRIDKKHARYLPLTTDVLVARLSGGVFIGFYPLSSGSECQWLAADFDGPTAMLDALAYTKAARSRGIPAALELSQSGRGAHVWIFFSGPVQAASARAVGTWLVREAILLRGSMDLRSYDRLFPNQDVVPEGSFGNLIAAPLQGTRRANGLTVFLDLATLEPHPDQWAFLSTLARLSPSEILRFAREASRSVTGPDVKTIERSSATKVNPPLPPVVRAELGAGLVIPTEQLTPAALATFKHAASMANPKFYELQRLRKSTWDTPRFIRGYDLTIDDQLVLPRALRHAIADLLASAGSRLDVTDLRQSGVEIEVSLATELQDAQASAVGELLTQDDGVLVAPPGSGKTVTACAMIAERGTSTLVLVDRMALAEQWRRQLERFLGVRPGQLGGGRKKLTRVIDIAMLPSLARRDDIADLTAGYGQVIVDECHHLGAAAYEHSVKPIGARYWLGLTATLTRRDGLSDLVTWQLGPVRHTFEAGRDRDTLLDLRSEPGPLLRLHLHDTAFTHGDIDLSEPAPTPDCSAC
ncbi:MAG: DEAD/DEAH box helicase family protein [Micropruina sp.]|uniref:TOTE conflict system archaeo-eukaryotic primase domain-containing protein n=1 Tax=Micropruina sp. TaxID=2737536 RepID=UPI0039E44706